MYRKVFFKANRTWWLYAAGLWMFCFCPSHTFAQESGTIKGVVLEAGRSVRIAYVNVRNQQIGTTVSTDNIGGFTIYATVGDTLVFSKVGYIPERVPIHTLSDILIDLKTSSTVLETVTVERMSQEQELQDVMEGYKRHGVYREGKPPALAYIFQPITALYERFSRSGKNARRFSSFMENELAATHVNRVFNPQKITDLTGLTGDDLRNFSLLYRPSYQQALDWAEYDVIHYIMTSFKQFEKDGRPEAPKLPSFDGKSLAEPRN